ncbi:NAD(P)H-dependent FMN reductase [Tepidamorphus gemmatus]|uniref:NAD(P)H-dependent FMN reductase n=1 Tax=Tepidamorphus gemmatus TaxID=747076 RepID=A0A4R3MEK7_9HYPH|nr:NAD(P)H-dependent oxidoreductase [Tepidamorphus gemmatus]TCT11941.1 NAD(P)H-dependent FMN reductase [Tepidamorphus gemmatus]
MSKPKILLFAGSIRTGSINEKLAVVAAGTLAEAGGDVSHISLADYPMPIYNGDLEQAEGIPDAAKRLANLFTEHQGILIVAPEYNGGITPLLKNTIDWVSRPGATDRRPGPYKGRVFALGAASDGGFGGYRGLLQLRHTLENALGALMVPEMVSVPAAASAFDAEGRLIAERPMAMLRTVSQRLVEMARTFAA